MLEFQIESYDNRKHSREGFSCGKPSLDNFLQHQISQYEKRRLGRTYVAIEVGNSRAIGYFTLASSSIAFAAIPPDEKKLPRHPVPVVLLARLAVDRSAQKCGVGKSLLINAIKRSWEVSHSIGAYAIEVHALDEEAASFYEKYGFKRLLDDAHHMFISMKTVDQLFSQSSKSTK